MERKTILKEASVLLIASLMVLSSLVTTANTNNKGTELIVTKWSDPLALVNEDFESGIMPPTGWTLNDPTCNWDVTTNAFFGNYSAKFYDTTSSKTTELISPVIDCTGMSKILLGFWLKQPSSAKGQDTLTILISTDGGVTWPYIVAQYSSEVPKWEHELIDLSAYAAGQSTVKALFEATGGGGTGIFIDRIGGRSIGEFHNSLLDYYYTYDPLPDSYPRWMPKTDLEELALFVANITVDEFDFDYDIAHEAAHNYISLLSDMNMFFDLDSITYYGYPVFTDNSVEYDMNYLVNHNLTTEDVASEIIHVGEMVWDRVKNVTILDYVRSLPDLNWSYKERNGISVFVDVFIQSYEYWFSETKRAPDEGKGWKIVWASVKGAAKGYFSCGDADNVAAVAGGIIYGAIEDVDASKATTTSAPQHTANYNGEAHLVFASGGGAFDIQYRELEVYNKYDSGIFTITEDLDNYLGQYKTFMYPGQYGLWNPANGSKVTIEFKGIFDGIEQSIYSIQREKTSDDGWTCRINTPNVTSYQIKGYMENDLVFDSVVSGNGWVTIGTSSGDGQSISNIWLPQWNWDWPWPLPPVISAVFGPHITWDPNPWPDPFPVPPDFVDLITDNGTFKVDDVSIEPKNYSHNWSVFQGLTEVIISGENLPQFTITEINQSIVHSPLDITIRGGFGVSAIIKNIGTKELIDIPWSITLDGKLIFFGQTKSGIITSLAPGESMTIRDFLILGFGETGIGVKARDNKANATGIAILFFIVGVK